MREPNDDGSGTHRTGGTRLRHRLPVRLRQNWKLPAVIVVGLLALVLVFGEARVRPFITSELASDDEITNDVTGEGDLFDGGDHEIEVTFNEDEYADMMRTFREEGEKEYVSADITIDGTTINDVGLRLKGNSTLSSLSGDGGMPGMPNGEEGEEGAFPAPPGAEEGTEGRQEGDGQGGGPGGGGLGMVTLSEDEPENIPWLISFDEFSSGRAYQGHTEITLRPAAGGTDTAVNEALALELTAADGQTTQDYTFTSFSVNGGEAVPRLLLDSPDAAWAGALGNGVLYKGRASGSFDYLGGDPTDYEESFDQLNAEVSQDLQPIMNLLEFVEESDDEEFARDLDDYVDVESFARYLALQNLMSNGDAMDGPGNNYYLWYDIDEERFTVLSWDLNLSFSGMGGGMPGAGQDGEMPEGMPRMPGGEDGEMPEGFPDFEDGEMPEGMSEMGRGSGALKERFMENEDFQELYERSYADLYQNLVEDGTADQILSEVVGRAEAAGDEGARAAGETLAEQVEAISAEPSEDVGLFPGGGTPPEEE